MSDKLPSFWLEKAIEQLSQLPGIGQKTALRLALFILRRPESFAEGLSGAIHDLKANTLYCEKCHNISDASICQICADTTRNTQILCVVETVRDVVAIERTRLFNGIYHVLGGVISPIDGIHPHNLEIESLVNRIQPENIQEVILAISPTMEGETTSYYLYKRLRDFGIRITQLSRGLAMGDLLEYADEITLARAIQDRADFDRDML